MRLFLITSLLCLIVWTGSTQTATNDFNSNSASIAAYQLGSSYLQGNVGSVDYNKSYNEFIKSANSGYAPAFYALGYMHFKGLGVEQNYILAVDYFEKAAKEGVAEADMMLGSCFYHGVGKKENADSALYHLRKASIAGSTQAYSIHKRILELGSRSYTELPRIQLVSPIEISRIPSNYKPITLNQSISDLAGDWEGKWVTYDWSGNKIMDQAIVNLSIISVGGIIQYTINFLECDLNQFESDSYDLIADVSSISGSIDKRSFTGDLQTWKVTKLNHKESGSVLQIDIHTSNTSTKEPGQPVSIFLVRSDQKFDHHDGLKVFPNPSTDFFTVQLESAKAYNAAISVFSLDGKEVIAVDSENFGPGTNQQRIKWPDDLVHGIYVIKVQGDKHVKSAFIIKK